MLGWTPESLFCNTGNRISNFFNFLVCFLISIFPSFLEVLYIYIFIFYFYCSCLLFVSCVFLFNLFCFLSLLLFVPYLPLFPSLIASFNLSLFYPVLNNKNCRIDLWFDRNTNVETSQVHGLKCEWNCYYMLIHPEMLKLSHNLGPQNNFRIYWQLTSL